MASSPPVRPQEHHHPHPHYHQKQQLYPIRVDVTSNDRQLRLVDTLLWDPSVGVPEEPDQLALDLVRDAVVLGMGRAARHFTNRLEIFETVELQQKISRQLADQFRAVREIEALPDGAAAAAAATITTTTPAAATNDGNNEKKRKRGEDETSPPAADSNGAAAAMEKDTSAGVVAVKEEENTTAKTAKTEDGATTNNTAKDSAAASPAARQPAAPTTKNLIPIHLRLSVHGVRVHDEFDYDPQVASPLQVAQSIATDLKLSPEMAVSVAVDIAEQAAAAAAASAAGRSSSPLVLPDRCQVVEEDEGGPQERRNLTAAWTLPNRVHVTNVAHLVAQHRPMEPKK